MRWLKSAESWARIGYVARGIVYILLGGAVIATGRGASTGTTLEMILELPMGAVWLGVIAVGLFAYGLFRLYEAAFDLEHRGDQPSGRIVRAGRALGGLGYWALAGVASKTLWEGARASHSGEAEREMAKEVVRQSGSWGLAAIALIVLGVALSQARRAWTCDFSWQCRDAPGLVRWLGQAGYAARAVIIALVGWFMLRAAFRGGHGIKDASAALDAIRGHDVLIVLVGIGLLLFGLFSLALARWRHIPRGEGIAKAGRKVREKILEAG